MFNQLFRFSDNNNYLLFQVNEFGIDKFEFVESIINYLLPAIVILSSYAVAVSLLVYVADYISSKWF